jgi:hypothetical protein
MISDGQRAAINAELDHNLKNGQRDIAFLIHSLQTYSEKRTSKRREILEQTINKLRELNHGDIA